MESNIIFEKGEFAKGSCFGYYDDLFEECTLKCSISSQCQKATNSSNVQDFRSIEDLDKLQNAIEAFA